MTQKNTSVIILFCIGVVLFIIGMVTKFMEWPGTSPLMLLAMISFAWAGIILIFKIINRKKDQE